MYLKIAGTKKPEFSSGFDERLEMIDQIMDVLFICAVAEGEDGENGFTWSLKNNLFDALVELNLLQEIETTIYPDTLLPNEELLEGSKRTITVNSYERNIIARKKCISHYGAKCVICSMDFSKIYGSIGDGFIHVHHLIEISTIKLEYKVNSISDLRPVCPNCHAMLHKKNPHIVLNN